MKMRRLAQTLMFSLSLAGIPATAGAAPVVRVNDDTQSVAYQRAVTSSPADLWQSISAKNDLGLGQADIKVRDGFFQVFGLDMVGLESHLRLTPGEFDERAKHETLELMLPMPDGTFQRFEVVEYSMMEPALAAEFPQLKTYTAKGIDDPTASARLDVTPAGFHAQVLSADRTVYVDPYKAGDTTHYISYDKKGLRGRGQWTCFTDTVEQNLGEEIEADKTTRTAALTNGGTLRTYRLAMAATGEYTAFHGGTVSGAMSAITTTVNRVNGIYEKDISARMVLVGNNSSVVYTNASTDPYTNNNGSTMLTENQNTLNSVIGSANYDIGHVVSTGGGGVAYLRSLCASNKAGGVTGSPSPVGDAFDVDYVAHEVGHQFGGNHTFNGTSGSCGGGNRNAATAHEPGSGSTIQAYAGICGTNNLQANSNPYFHAVSIEEMVSHTLSATCGTQTSTGNSAPVIGSGFQTTYSVAANTPFTLTAAGVSDPNGDALTYCWEQYDAGAARFRSLNPTTSTSRTFGNVANPTSGNTAWESLLTTTGTLHFKCTVRDGRGGVNVSNLVTVNVGGGTTPTCSSGNAAIGDGTATSGSLATTDCTTTAGNAAAGGYYDLYTFSGTAGSSVTITLNSTAFDAYLRLKNSAGTVVASDDDGNGGTNSKITYSIASTGTYTIETTSYSPGSTGAYTITRTGGGTGGGTGGTNLVTNGGFESGTTGWTFATYSSVTTGAPWAGVNKAQQLGRGTTTSTNFWQTISGFNGTAKTLKFYLKMSSGEGTGTAYDYLRVRIYNASGTLVSTLATFDNRQKNTYAGWTLVTLSIPATSAVANYRLQFDASEDSSIQTTFYIDDVSIQ